MSRITSVMKLPSAASKLNVRISRYALASGYHSRTVGFAFAFVALIVFWTTGPVSAFDLLGRRAGAKETSDMAV
jgi:hypothetical protein